MPVMPSGGAPNGRPAMAAIMPSVVQSQVKTCAPPKLYALPHDPRMEGGAADGLASSCPLPATISVSPDFSMPTAWRIAAARSPISVAQAAAAMSREAVDRVNRFGKQSDHGHDRRRLADRMPIKSVRPHRRIMAAAACATEIGDRAAAIRQAVAC